ncbi:MAG: hypothetical protein P4L91_14655 [Burkholderiaceae bacterium]|nr:hypothetical protein [Burkholderiaceae bacterium]
MSIGKPLRIVVWSVALFLASGALGLYVVGTSAYWKFIKWLPAPIEQFANEVLVYLVKPILVENVNASEEQLDFYQAWIFCFLVLWLVWFLAALFTRKLRRKM